VALALVIHGRLTRHLARARPWLTGTAIALLLSQCLGIWKLGHAVEGGPKPALPTMLELTDYFLPEVEQARRATVLAGVPCRFQVEWATMLRLGSLDRLENNWLGFAAAGLDHRQGFLRWLHKTRVDTLISLEARPGSYCWEKEGNEKLKNDVLELLKGQKIFRKVKEHEFPHLSCAVAVWKRASPGDPAD
jgi:hypothetical protein